MDSPGIKEVEANLKSSHQGTKKDREKNLMIFFVSIIIWLVHTLSFLESANIFGPVPKFEEDQKMTEFVKCFDHWHSTPSCLNIPQLCCCYSNNGKKDKNVLSRESQ